MLCLICLSVCNKGKVEYSKKFTVVYSHVEKLPPQYILQNMFIDTSEGNFNDFSVLEHFLSFSNFQLSYQNPN